MSQYAQSTLNIAGHIIANTWIVFTVSIVKEREEINRCTHTHTHTFQLENSVSMNQEWYREECHRGE